MAEISSMRLRAHARATRSAWRSRHSSPAPPVPAARRATVAPQSPSCAEQKNAWGHSHRRPKGRHRQLFGSAPAPLRACARHHSSCVTLRLRFNLLPHPGVSIIRAAPQELGWTDGRDLRLDVRWAAAKLDQIRMFAKELVDLQPDVIFGNTTVVTAALQRETRTIPVVFV